ncbi:unnamed protein product [Mesocestoides corti]|uniref:Transposase n=1 Tax=Mesocestoides corti TaxID=53468 RepID=A0A0R3UJZ9_MESCO|nr:unnamed protein product [Mesocestoides corti]
MIGRGAWQVWFTPGDGRSLDTHLRAMDHARGTSHPGARACVSRPVGVRQAAKSRGGSLTRLSPFPPSSGTHSRLVDVADVVKA